MRLVCIHTTPDNTAPKFQANVTDYFKLLAQDEHSLLIGARYVLCSVIVCIVRAHCELRPINTPLVFNC